MSVTLISPGTEISRPRLSEQVVEVQNEPQNTTLNEAYLVRLLVCRQRDDGRRKLDLVDVLLVLVLLDDAVILRGESDGVLSHVLGKTILCSVQLELNLLMCLAINEQLGPCVKLKERSCSRHSIW